MTLFVIVGIVFVAFVVLVYFLAFQKPSIEKEVAEITSLEDELVALEDYVQDCSDARLLTGMNTFGRQFALLDAERPYSIYGPPLFYADGEKNVPELSSVQKEIETLIEEEVSDCVQAYPLTVADSLDVGRTSVRLEFEEETTAIVSVDATLLFENKSISLIDDITSVQNGSIKNYLAVADLFVADYIKNNGTFCISCFVAYNEKYGVTFSIIPVGEEQLVIMNDPNYLVEGIPYEFRFGVENIA